MNVEERLLSLRDEQYRDFHLKLCPGLEPERVIGVRAPELRKLARELIKSGEAGSFMAALPHPYYEMDNIHGFIISDIREYDRCLEALRLFLPWVNNWATCDSIHPRSFKVRPAGLTEEIQGWLASGQCYTLRFGIEMLMVYYLDEGFSDEYLLWVASVKSEEYYVRMMKAWYFAEALAKQWDAAIVYLQRQKLSLWVHNKAIQKAVESYRISPEHKEYLRTLRRKSLSNK